jgi:hypothetical protein
VRLLVGIRSRWLALIVAAAFTVTHRSAGQSTLAGRPVIIFVHGRGLSGLPADSVSKAWIQSFQEGQRRIGFTRIRDDDIRVAWYGSASLGAACVTTDGSLNVDRRSFLQRLAEILARFPSIEERAGRAFFADTQEYFSDGCYQGQVDRALEMELASARLAKRPVVLVAHSMGSLVAFAVLTRMWIPAEGESVGFITFGSMLGMEEMPRALLGAYVESPVPVPQALTRWINVRNDGDVLSFPTSGRFRSIVPPRIPVDVMINAQGAGRHSAETYLRDPTFALVIATAWCGASARSDRPPECSGRR